MTIFVVGNWFLSLLTSWLLTGIFIRHRFLFVKPSFIVISFFHVILQWPATVKASEIESYLPDPYAFAMLAQGFPLIGLVVSFFLARKDAYTVWQRITTVECAPAPGTSRSVVVLSGVIGGILIVYLSAVPLSQTGAYAILFDPVNAARAREESLKVLGRPVLVYLYVFMSSVAAPLLGVHLSSFLFRAYRERRFGAVAVSAVGMAAVLVAVSLSGARSFAAMILATAVFAFWLRRRMPLNVFYLMFGFGSILALPVVLTVLREGQEVGLAKLWNYYVLLLGDRIFASPVRVSLFYVHYAQTVSLVGVGGIPKLAALAGVNAVDVPNLVGVLYVSDAIPSISAGTSYVFSYYSYFGLASLPFALLGLWLLDGALWVYRRLGDYLLLPCVASVGIAGVAFVQSDYTTAWVTHGFGLLLVGAFVLDRLCRMRI